MVVPFQWCRSFETVFCIFHVKKGFYVQKWRKKCIIWGQSNCIVYVCKIFSSSNFLIIVKNQGVLKSFDLQISDKLQKTFFFGFGCKLAIFSKKFVQWTFSKKVLFGKSDSNGPISKFMTFFEHIYIIVLPKQQFLPHKKNGQISFFGRYWLRMAAYMPIFTLLKKLCLVYFSKVIKIGSKKRKMSSCPILKKAWRDVFEFFITYNF